MERIKIKTYIKRLIFFIAFVIFLTSIYPALLIADEEESIKDIEGKLLTITEEEKEILEYLFLQVQEIEELERLEIKLNDEINTMQFEIESLGDKIESEEISYDKYKYLLKEVLKTYQRMGPGTYLEIILSSESMSDLFNRINTLRDLTKGTGKLLDSLDQTLLQLTIEKSNLDEKIKLMEKNRLTLRESIDKKAIVIKAKESYLESLAGDREYFMLKLDYMNSIMNELKVLISELSEEFENLIENSNFPEDAINLEFTLVGMKGSVNEDVFNKIISEHKSLPHMKFSFKNGKIELVIPERNVYFSGNFIIVNGNSLKYEISEGSIFHMKLEKSSIDNLFDSGYFVLNLEPLVGKNTIKSIESKSGYIDLIIGIKLF